MASPRAEPPGGRGGRGRGAPGRAAPWVRGGPPRAGRLCLLSPALGRRQAGTRWRGKGGSRRPPRGAARCAGTAAGEGRAGHCAPRPRSRRPGPPSAPRAPASPPPRSGRRSLRLSPRSPGRGSCRKWLPIGAVATLPRAGGAQPRGPRASPLAARLPPLRGALRPSRAQGRGGRGGARGEGRGKGGYLRGEGGRGQGREGARGGPQPQTRPLPPRGRGARVGSAMGC